MMTKRNQSPRKLRGPIHRTVDLTDRLPRSAWNLFLVSDMLAGTEDDGEEVIDVVGHAARQSAQGFHFFGPVRRFFQAFVGRDVCYGFDNMSVSILCDSF